MTFIISFVGTIVGVLIGFFISIKTQRRHDSKIFDKLTESEHLMDRVTTEFVSRAAALKYYQTLMITITTKELNSKQRDRFLTILEKRYLHDW